MTSELNIGKLLRHANMPSINFNPRDIYEQNSSTSSIMYLNGFYCFCFDDRACSAHLENNFCMHKHNPQEHKERNNFSNGSASDQVQTISSRSLLTELKYYCLNHQLNLIGLRTRQLNKKNKFYCRFYGAESGTSSTGRVIISYLPQNFALARSAIYYDTTSRGSRDLVH